MTAPRDTHRVAYPLLVAGVWRATCACHMWQPIEGPVAWVGTRKRAAS